MGMNFFEVMFGDILAPTGELQPRGCEFMADNLECSRHDTAAQSASDHAVVEPWEQLCEGEVGVVTEERCKVRMS